MRDVFQDLRYGVRAFKANLSFTLVAVLALALGIGATTAIFSVVDRVLLRPLPYPEADRLVSIALGGGTGLPHPDYFDWRKRNNVFEELTMLGNASPRTLSGPEEATQIRCAGVTASFFRTFRVEPMLGRPFTEAEDKPGAPKVILLTHASWQARFAGSRNILGRTLTINDAPYTVIGIMPPSFRFPGATVEAITPLAFDIAIKAVYFLPVVGRLKPDMTLGQAAAQLEGLFSQRQRIVAGEKMKLSVVGLQDRQVANVRLAMWALLGAVGCVLLIACANVANLLLSRSAARRRELAVRSALGAGRMRLVRQLLTESLLLGVAGGAIGLLLAALTLKAIIHLAPTVPRIGDVQIDWRVLAFTLTVSLAVSVMFGLAPAFSAAHTDVNDALKNSSLSATSKNRFLRSVLVTAELALSLVLLAGAGLLVQTLWRLEHIHTGVVAEHVLTVDVYLNRKTHSSVQRKAFFTGILERVSSLSGVIAAGAGVGSPLSPTMTNTITVAGAQAVPDQVSFKDITPGYLEALRIPLRSGRLFNAQDGRAADVALINEALARRYFSNQNPVGKQVFSSGFDRSRTIVGVIGDVKNRGLQESTQPELYRLDEDGDVSNLVIRTIGDPLSLASLIREQVRAVDKNTPLKFSTITQQLDAEVSSQRFNSIVLSVFAGIALLLAAIGIYGVMSYLVTLRTREIGIRMALGARTGQVLSLVLNNALRLVLGGVAAGLVLAMGLTRYLETLLYGVKPADSATLASVALLLSVVALSASYFPALRAARVDPASALRSE